MSDAGLVAFLLGLCQGVLGCLTACPELVLEHLLELRGVLGRIGFVDAGIAELLDEFSVQVRQLLAGLAACLRLRFVDVDVAVLSDVQGAVDLELLYELDEKLAGECCDLNHNLKGELNC